MAENLFCYTEYLFCRVKYVFNEKKIGIFFEEYFFVWQNTTLGLENVPYWNYSVREKILSESAVSGELGIIKFDIKYQKYIKYSIDIFL